MCSWVLFDAALERDGGTRRVLTSELLLRTRVPSIPSLSVGEIRVHAPFSRANLDFPFVIRFGTKEAAKLTHCLFFI